MFTAAMKSQGVVGSGVFGQGVLEVMRTKEKGTRAR
jgi:hypothetical protein